MKSSKKNPKEVPLGLFKHLANTKTSYLYLFHFLLGLRAKYLFWRRCCMIIFGLKPQTKQTKSHRIQNGAQAPFYVWATWWKIGAATTGLNRADCFDYSVCLSSRQCIKSLRTMLCSMWFSCLWLEASIPKVSYNRDSRSIILSENKARNKTNTNMFWIGPFSEENQRDQFLILTARIHSWRSRWIFDCSAIQTAIKSPKSVFLYFGKLLK